MTVTIWLLWTLVAGQPQDVDSFLFQGQCKEALAAYQGVIAKAYEQTKNEELKKMELIGCIPLEIKTPAALVQESPK